MKDELIADIWTLVVEHIDEKYRKDVAADFVNTLMDYGIKESVIDSLRGIDTYLDTAVDYVLDGEEFESIEEEETDYNYDIDE